MRDQKKQKQEEVEAKQKEKEQYAIDNAAKIKKQLKKKAKKQEKKRQAEAATLSETLFVRNIGFETTAQKFKEFMEKFGPVKYAVLCKAGDSESKEGANKGTGFVQFMTQESAN